MATKSKLVCKEITNKEEVEYLLNITEYETLKTSFIMELFGEFNGKQKYQPYDEITIPPGSYGPEGKKNKNTFKTTIGLWIFNKCFIEKDLFEVLGYCDKTITNSEFNKINKKISYAIMEDDITVDVLKRFINKCQKYQPYSSVYCPSYTLKMLICTKEVDKKKAELMKVYGDRIKSGDPKAADALEKELLDYISDYLGDDPSMDMYKSGARGSFENNFKCMYVMKGAIKDPDPTKGYNIITSSFMEGIKKEEYAALSNALAAGPYARARKTASGGYLELLFFHACQHIKLDTEGSDCGTKRTIEVFMDNNALDDYMYSYVVEGSKLTEINSKTRDKFLNKTVRVRYSSLCENKKDGGSCICNKCAGNMLYKLGMYNAGEVTPQLASKIKNLFMKGFHDSTIQFGKMDVAKCFCDE